MFRPPVERKLRLTFPLRMDQPVAFVAYVQRQLRANDEEAP